jgi:RsiW-degrading membrane proteinase PrsW (M82 family)
VDSPLQQRRGRLALAAILAIMASMAAPIWVSWLTPAANCPILLSGMLAALFGSLPAFFVLRFLHRRHADLRPVALAVLGMATLLSTAVAAFLNTHSPATAITVGFNEEFWKVAPLLLLMIFLPRAVTGVRDGLVFGALGGIGFNIIELAVYLVRVSYPAHGLLLGLQDQFGRLGLWGVDNHVVWSALTGAGLGYIVQKGHGRLRYVVAAAAYLLAVLTHTLQDNVVGIVILMTLLLAILQIAGFKDADIGKISPETAEAARQFAQTAAGLEVLVINIVNLPLLLIALVTSGRWERRLIADRLADEPDGIVTEAEMTAARADRLLRTRRIPGQPRAIAKAIRTAQNALAFQKSHLMRRGIDPDADEVVAYWRSRLLALRSQAS